MRTDATSTELRNDRATQGAADRYATLGDAVFAGLSLPVWVLDVARFATATDRVRGSNGGGDDLHARFLNGATVLATNAAAVEFHRAPSDIDLLAARDRIFLPATVRAIAAAMSGSCAARHRDIDLELGVMDGTTQRVRAHIDFFATDASAQCCALTILPSSPRSNMLRVVPDVVFELDADGIYVDFAGSEDALLVPSEFIGRSITETMPPDVAHRALASLARLRERGGSERFEYALSMCDGLHWYEARMSALASGGVAAYVRDVTAQKSAEWRCQESEERCRTLDADLKARTLDLERAHHELERLRRSSNRPPPKARSRVTPSSKTK